MASNYFTKITKTSKREIDEILIEENDNLRNVYLENYYQKENTERISNDTNGDMRIFLESQKENSFKFNISFNDDKKQSFIKREGNNKETEKIHTNGEKRFKKDSNKENDGVSKIEMYKMKLQQHNNNKLSSLNKNKTELNEAIQRIENNKKFTEKDRTELLSAIERYKKIKNGSKHLNENSLNLNGKENYFSIIQRFEKIKNNAQQTNGINLDIDNDTNSETINEVNSNIIKNDKILRENNNDNSNEIIAKVEMDIMITDDEVIDRPEEKNPQIIHPIKTDHIELDSIKSIENQCETNDHKKHKNNTEDKINMENEAEIDSQKKPFFSIIDQAKNKLYEWTKCGLFDHLYGGFHDQDDSVLMNTELEDLNRKNRSMNVELDTKMETCSENSQRQIGVNSSLYQSENNESINSSNNNEISAIQFEESFFSDHGKQLEDNTDMTWGSINFTSNNFSFSKKIIKNYEFSSQNCKIRNGTFNESDIFHDANNTLNKVEVNKNEKYPTLNNETNFHDFADEFVYEKENEGNNKKIIDYTDAENMMIKPFEQNEKELKMQEKTKEINGKINSSLKPLRVRNIVNNIDVDELVVKPRSPIRKYIKPLVLSRKTLNDIPDRGPYYLQKKSLAELRDTLNSLE